MLRPAPSTYVPGGPVEGLTDGLARDLPAGIPQVRYVDASAAAGVVFRHFHGTRSHQLPEDMGSGAAWSDVDGDGDLDLFAVNEAGPLTERQQWGQSPAHNALFVNSGAGLFHERAAASGLDRRGMGQGAAFADIDGDGDADLAVSEYGPLLLYLNDGSGMFTSSNALAGDARFWSGLSWSDIDVDGDLDLYACAYVDYREDDPSLQGVTTSQYNTAIPATLNPSTFEPQANALWRNEGGSFVEDAVTLGIDNPAGRSLSATFADFDEDGQPDLYVANDLSDNVLYHNTGTAFTDVSHAAWVADYRGAMGLAVGDWDGDGDEDLFITHWIAQENALFANLSGDLKQADLDVRLRFMDTADQYGLGQIALDFVGWGTAFVDVDADGRLDLLVANGSTFEQEDRPEQLVPMATQLFWNAGPRDGFYEMGAQTGEALRDPIVGRGLAVADYDADGDMDAFVNVNGGDGVLLRHEGHSRHWLTVAPATGSRAHWPGAHIRVVAGDRVWKRQAAAGSSYLSQNALPETFGLGAVSVVDTVDVKWPDGRHTRLTALRADATVQVERTGR